MADNVQLEQVVTPGAILASDEIGGAQYQRVKIALGADGAWDMDLDSGQQSMATSLPVVIASDQTVIPVSDNGGSLTVDGTVSATQGTSPWVVGDGGGTLSVDDGGGSLTVDGSVTSSDPTTHGHLVTIIGHVDGVEGQLTTITGHVDGIEGALAALALLVDGVEGQLTTITGHVDGLEGLITAGNALLTTIDADTGNIATAAAAIQVSGEIIDDWDESDRCKVNPIVGQAGLQGASGAVSANTLRVTLATDVALPTGANTIGSIASITTSVTPGTGASNLGKAEDAGHTTGDVGVMALAVSNEANTARAADGDYLPLATDTEGNLRVVGNRDHDAVDAGEPVKVGVKTTDYEPDASAEPSGNKGEVAAADRSDLAANRFGELIEGVNPQAISLSALNVTYDDSPTTAVSADIECWNYRRAAFGLTIDSTNTPTSLRIDVEVSYDGTNFYKLMNGPLGMWIYDATSTATAISRSLEFPIAARLIRVRITGTGTTAANTFAVTNAYLYLRN